MRVFLSWSGARSRMLAEALRDWLPNVLQSVDPWMSAVDMPIGARWNIDLAKELETAKVGIVCVTSDNQAAPWMLFEAGALSKIVDSQCVIPYLLNLRAGEVQGPLVQFQAAVADRDDTFKVVSTVNRVLGSLGTLTLSDEALERSFQMWWPVLAAAIDSIPRIVEGVPPPRPDRDLLEEILNLSRQNTREQVERTAMAEATAKLRQQDLMVMTHQIQGPLLPVIGVLSHLARQPLPGTALSLVEQAQEMVEDLLALVYGVSTAFATAQGHRVTLRLVDVDVQAELQKQAARIRRTTDRQDLHFRFEKSAGFPNLLLDESSFTSVVYSLLHNAAKFADSGSEVVLRCSFAGRNGLPVLTVTSTGEPISAAERNRIFEKFERGGLTDSGRYAGAGLGLWVARELMRQLGGDVTLNLSVRNPGIATFVVHFSSASVG